MSETRTYQGHTYSRAGPGQPWTLAGPAAGGGRVVYPDKYKPREQDRADRNTALDADRVNLQAQNNDREAKMTRLQMAKELRQEFERLPDVANYREAVRQAHKAMTTDPNPQGDLALTYAFAKAMDPSSAVRDGEQEMATNTQPWLQAAAEQIKKQFGMSDAGTFTPVARAALRQQIFHSLASGKPLYDARRAEYERHATANLVDPYEVIGQDDTATYSKAFRTYAEHNGDPQGVISNIIGGDPIKPGGDGNGPNAPLLKAAGQGATQTQIPIPPEMQQEHADYLAKHWGAIDPHDYAAFRTNLDAKYHLTANDPATYLSSASDFNKFAQGGGKPEMMPGIPGPMRDMSADEKVLNDIASSRGGTAVASAADSMLLGLPELKYGDKLDAMKQMNPGSAIVGDLVGGAIGAGGLGGLMRGGAKLAGPELASILSKPVAADMAYGSIYGGNHAAANGENVALGMLTGGAGGYAGNKIGRAMGAAFPALAGKGAAIRRLDASVPTSDDLKSLASNLYGAAEAKGLTATPDETLALADTTKGILSNEGRLSPKDRLTEVHPKVREAYNLIDDYAGQPMNPTQVQTVRGIIADGLSSKVAGEQRVAGKLLDNFDNWTDSTNPDLAAGLKDARGVASRYLQGDRLRMADELADARAGQYSQSGRGNAVRTDFRALDKGITTGSQRFAPNVEEAIKVASRGTPTQNALRYFGKFAPMGPISLPALASAGHVIGGPNGTAVGAGLGIFGLAARKAEQSMANRAATVAENSAYGGQGYTDALKGIVDQAGNQVGHAGAGMLSTTASPITADLIAKALLALKGQQAVAQ